MYKIFFVLVTCIVSAFPAYAQQRLTEKAMTYWDNTWYQLTDYTRFQAPSAAACQSACYNGSACIAYTYNTQTKSCNTSYNYPVQTDANRPGWISGFKNDRKFEDIYTKLNTQKFVDFRNSTWYEFSNYQRFKRDNEEACRLTCEITGGCNAFTFNKSNNNCNISAETNFRTGSGSNYSNFVSGHVVAQVSIQKGVDYVGNDYRRIEVGDDPSICQRYCVFDKNCKAFTFVLPGTIQGPRPVCYLKSKGLTWENGGQTRNGNTVSGIKEIERR